MSGRGTWSERAFEAALKTWPRDQREEFGASMKDTFRARLTSASRKGRTAALALAAREVLSVAALGLEARFRRSAPLPSLPEVRYGVRQFARRPGFAAIVVVTLAVGVGLNAAVFSVIHAVVLSPLPFEDAGSLVALWSTREGERTPGGNVSWLDLEDFRAGVGNFAEMGAYARQHGPATLLAGDRPELVDVARVTERYFATLGLRPLLGRAIERADLEEADVALLSEAAWRTRWGGDDAVLGQVVMIDDRPHRIVGVMPDVARHAPSGAVDVWTPYRPGNQSRGSRNLLAVALLDPEGGDIVAARAELDALTRALAESEPDSNTGVGADVEPLASLMVGADVPRLLRLLAAAAGVLLLLSIANVANLYLARSLERGRDVAVLVAVGASRSRALAPFLVEALAVTLTGAAAAVAIAAWLPGWVLGAIPESIPRAGEVRLGAPVVVFAVAVAMTAALASTALPAWIGLRQPLRRALAGEGAIGGRRRGRSSATLATVQVAGAVAVLSAAGALLSSFAALTSVDPGFRDRGALVARLDMPASRYPDAASIFGFQERLFQGFAESPGVRAVAGVSVVPFSGGNLCDAVAGAGTQPLERCAEYRSITPGYLDALGIALLAGRDFAEDDVRGAPPVAILGRSAAALLFPAGDAVGSSVEGRDATRTVVGVAEDVRQFTLDAAPRPMVYLPYRQAPFRFLSVVVTPEAEGSVSVRDLEQRVRALDPAMAVPELTPIGRLIDRTLAVPKLRAVMVGSLGAISLTIALLGVTGLLAYTVRLRRRELGIRMAVGGGAAAVRRLVVLDALRLLGVGVALGWALAIASGRLLETMLYEVRPSSAGVLLAVAALVLGTGFLAALLPARAAASLDPARTLRNA